MLSKVTDNSDDSHLELDFNSFKISMNTSITIS